jgi:phenylalanine-4-hydroxylase
MNTSADNRVSMLIELLDEPGSLEKALHVFSSHSVNLTHIESRPEKGGRFDFYVDCEGGRGDEAIEAVINELDSLAEKMLVLDTRVVPWFPRHIAELDLIADHTLEAGSDLQADHPGFNDETYRERRALFEQLAKNNRYGDSFPVIEYSDDELATWNAVFSTLKSLHEKHACSAYRHAMADLDAHCGFNENRIPQAGEISRFLESRTGFRLRPVAGLLSPRDFLNGLAFRVFFSTQYIRHGSVPGYTPEPDICHELLGHAPMFADPAFADLSQEIGLASLGASEAEIERLSRCYWHSVEFGLVREDGELKAYGAGLLSSPGELTWACESGKPVLESWRPSVAADQDYPITEYQPRYFVADSLQDGKSQMQDFARNLQRPFYARFNPTTHRIWVDRAVSREVSVQG